MYQYQSLSNMLSYLLLEAHCWISNGNGPLMEIGHALGDVYYAYIQLIFNLWIKLKPLKLLHHGDIPTSLSFFFNVNGDISILWVSDDLGILLNKLLLEDIIIGIGPSSALQEISRYSIPLELPNKLGMHPINDLQRYL